MGNWKKVPPNTWVNNHFIVVHYRGPEKAKYILVDINKGLMAIFKGTLSECRAKAEELLKDDEAYSEYVAAKMNGELD